MATKTMRVTMTETYTIDVLIDDAENQSQEDLEVMAIEEAATVNSDDWDTATAECSAVELLDVYAVGTKQSK